MADCPHAGRCGGCDFLDAPPEEALRLKAEASLGRLAERLKTPLNLVEAPVRERYRVRAVVHLAGGAVGFFDAGRHIVEFEDCLLLAPPLMDAVRAIRPWAAGLDGEAEIRLEAEATGAVRVAISPPPPPFVPRNHSQPAAPRFSPALREALRRFPLPCSVRETYGGPGEFSQVNPAVNELMVGHILDLARPLAPGRGLDLYAGHGNIAVPLMSLGFAMTAVERNAAACAGARRLGGGRLKVVRGRCEPRLLRALGDFKLVVLDPPRAGAKDLAPTLAALGPRLIIYVSCHPAALARDVPAFISLGYRPRNLTAFDMFPRTRHLETVLALAL